MFRFSLFWFHLCDLGQRWRPETVAATSDFQADPHGPDPWLQCGTGVCPLAIPHGKEGLVLKNGKLSPGGEELQRMLAISGPAVKPGDQARISQIVIKGDRIRFE